MSARCRTDRSAARRRGRGVPDVDTVTAMQQRYLGRTGLQVSRLGLGTLTWGRDTDEHEARDQLVAFTEAGGTLVDTAAGYGEGASEELVGSLIGDVVASATTWCSPPRPGSAAAATVRETNASRGYLIRTLDASLRRLGVDHVDLWQVHTWVDDTPLEETLSALDYAVSDRPGGVRRGLELHAAGRARRPRPGSAPSPGARARLHPGRVLAGQPPGRGGGAAGCRGARAGRAAVVAAGPRRAHRQVPARHPRRLPRRLPALRELRRQLPHRAARPDRRGGGPRGGRAGAGPRSRWP